MSRWRVECDRPGGEPARPDELRHSCRRNSRHAQLHRRRPGPPGRQRLGSGSGPGSGGTYATGGWSLNNLLEEINRKGLETLGTAKRAAGPLYLSHLHRILIHPYYKGLVRYRGVEYAGQHEPLVTAETWQRTQDVLKAHYTAGERQRQHNHYLKGSIYCDRCKSRLIITNARNRHGKVYPYFVCSGRHQKRTDCTFSAALIETVERKVLDHYASQQLPAEVRKAVEDGLTAEFEAFFQETNAERKLLDTRRQQLLAERSKLLKAHYADAIPLDLLKTEQKRIADQLAYIEQRHTGTDHEHAMVMSNFQRTLDLATDLQAAYQAAPQSVRRQFNQAIFKKLYLCDDGEVRAELAEPFDIILDKQLHQRALKLANQPPAKPTLVEKTAVAQPDWQLWETSFNNNAHEEHDLVGIETPRRPFGRLGLTKEHMVDARGVLSNPPPLLEGLLNYYSRK